MRFRGSVVWSRFWSLTVPFFRSELRWRAAGLLAVLVAFLFCVSGLNVVNSYANRDFMTAVAQRNGDAVLPLALRYVGVFGVCAVIAALYRFTEERLSLLWRRWLTGYLVGRYLADEGYKNTLGRVDLDNPDQRMTDDVRVFCATTLSFLLIGLNATITLVAFSGVLWSITPYLVLAAAAYAAVGSLAAVFLGRPLLGLNIRELKLEADLRAELLTTRKQAEAGELIDGEAATARVGRRLTDMVENMKRIIGVNRTLGFFTTGYNYLVPVIPVLVVAPVYLRGDVEFGVVTQAGVAFTHVLGAFSLIVSEFQRITSFNTVVTRVGSLEEAIRPPATVREMAVETAGPAGDNKVASPDAPTALVPACTADTASHRPLSSSS